MINDFFIVKKERQTEKIINRQTLTFYEKLVQLIVQPVDVLLVNDLSIVKEKEREIDKQTE